MDSTLIVNPVITPAIVALAASGATLAMIIKNMTAITATLKQIRTKLFTRAGLFWTVNLVFMAVSVLHAGIFFGITGNGHALPGAGQMLGFAVSFFLDLVTIVLMQAMLEARYRGEEGRARQLLLFIAICCGTSTFANLAISLNDFNAATMLPHAPGWLQAASPYVLASFPLFVIMMSIAAEMIVNVRPLESLNEQEYEADEIKRINILQIRNTYLQKQADEELRMLTIRAQMKANKLLQKGKMPNSFRWFWEKPVQTSVIITEITEQFKALYEPQIETLKKRLEEVNAPINNAGFDAIIKEPQPEADHMNNVPPSWLYASTNETSTGSIPATRDEQNDVMPQVSGPIQMETWLLEISKNYPRVASEWLAAKRKTVTIDEIVMVTGHAKRKVVKAPFKRSTRNPDLVLVSSVMEWLKTAPLPANTSRQKELTSDELPVINDTFDEPQNSDTHSELLTENSEYTQEQSTDGLPAISGDTAPENLLIVDGKADKLSITLSIIRQYPDVSDGELAAALGLTRLASARAFRLKAQSLLAEQQNGHNGHSKETVKLDEYPEILV
jgi:hypothetical protein